MTSSATLVWLVWVHAFQMEVMDIVACSCWGHWQASASAGLVPGGCVTVTPLLAVAWSLWLCLHRLLAWPCSSVWHEQ